jgi:hypothetical protein
VQASALNLLNLISSLEALVFISDKDRNPKYPVIFSQIGSIFGFGTVGGRRWPRKRKQHHEEDRQSYRLD